MTKKVCFVMLAVCFGLSLVVAPAVAAEKSDKPAKESKANKENGNGEVTQGELACLLVQVMGLSRFLPAGPSTHDCIQAMLQNGVVPPGGWVADKVVVRGDLACIIVGAMGYTADMKKSNDPKECVVLLTEMGITIDTVGAAVDQVEPSVEPVAPRVDDVSTDPLAKKLPQQFNPVDELSSGVDMAAVVRTDIVPLREIQEVVAVVVVVPDRPDDVTPD